jgi:hypothetical protein
MMAFNDGTIVEKQEVWHVLNTWGHTRKKKAMVPAQSRPHERSAHLTALRGVYVPRREDMVRQQAPHSANSHLSLCSSMRRPLRAVR